MYLYYCENCANGLHRDCECTSIPSEGQYGGKKCICPCNGKSNWNSFVDELAGEFKVAIEKSKRMNHMNGLSKTEYERRLSFALQESAKAWCTEETKHTPMDVTLGLAFAKILVEHMYAPHLGCATTGELLDEVRARVDTHYSTISRQ